MELDGVVNLRCDDQSGRRSNTPKLGETERPVPFAGPRLRPGMEASTPKVAARRNDWLRYGGQRIGRGSSRARTGARALPCHQRRQQRARTRASENEELPSQD